MPTRKLWLPSVFLPALILCACGGGGGGGLATGPGAGATTSPPPAPVQTQVFPITNSGVGQEITFSQPTFSTSNATTTFGSPTAPQQTATFGEVGGVFVFQIQSGARSLRVAPSINPTDVISDGSIDGLLISRARGVDPTLRVIAVVNQSRGAWDYPPPSDLQEWQTFGYWALDDRNPVNRSGAFGSFSVGTATAGASIPSSGAVTFNGNLLGNQLIGGMDSHEVAATMALSVNFANRTADFSSMDWRDQTTVFAGTALHGTLSYPSQQNALSGLLTTANGAFSGPAVAQFYGPAAQEVGGAFTLLPANGGPDRVIGAFGAKR